MKTWIAFVAAGLFAGAGPGTNELLGWPRFRGPGGTGVADVRFVYAGNDGVGGDRLERSLEDAARRIGEAAASNTVVNAEDSR